MPGPPRPDRPRIHRLRPAHLMTALLLAGGVCVLASPPPAPEGDAPWRAPLAERVAAPFPRAVGATAVRTEPQRIVAASVLSAEELLALDVGDRLAGVTFLAADGRYSTVAARAAALPVVGQTPERLLAARPDLVVLDEFTSADTPLLLGSAGVPVVRTRAVRTFDDVVDNVRLLGWIVGRDAAAEAIVDDLRARRRGLGERAAELRGTAVMNLNGDLDTYGADSLLDAAIGLSGATNLPAARGVGGYQKLSVETVLGWRPDALVVGVEPDAPDGAPDWLRQHPGLRLLPCVQDGRVLALPSALLGTTSHRAIEVAERLQAALLARGPR
ncbi:MAG: ABC transporter substrate-binding protein [Planctomycetota bacterium]